MSQFVISRFATQKMLSKLQFYLTFESIKGTPDIKVITGVRRSGKSELMKSFIRLLKEEEPGANIVFLDLLLHENESLLDKESLTSSFLVFKSASNLDEPEIYAVVII